MIVTGLQPTGSIHIGNYLGAIKPLMTMQRTSETLVFIADYHAITMAHDPEELRRNTVDLAATLMACGLTDASIFKQSDVPAHVELGWILQCTAARCGWLNRMVQFREKSGHDRREVLSTLEEIADATWVGDDAIERIQRFARKSLDAALVGENAEGPSVGLYTYPVLQAADVLLHQATHVPVGEDQSQHLNLVVDIAQKFNRDFGVTFAIPKAIIHTEGKRVMSLHDGSKKMSKSDENADSRIHITDDPDTIRRKIKRATSDTAFIPATIDGLLDRPELTNLLRIYSLFSGLSLSEALSGFEGKGYGILKPALSEAIVEGLRAIREEHAILMSDRGEIERILSREGDAMRQMCEPTLVAAKHAIGIV